MKVSLLFLAQFIPLVLVFLGVSYFNITVIIIIIFVLLVLLNLRADIYGILRSTRDRRLTVYHDEKVTKLLQSRAYIPTNFDAVIVGTSLSANLDVSPEKIPKTRLRFYNASVMGANVSEVTAIVKNVIEGGVQHFILCLSPYMFKGTGVRVQVPSRMAVLLLSAPALIKAYIIAFIRFSRILPRKYPRDQYNAFGVNRYHGLLNVGDIRKKMREVIEDNKNKPLMLENEAATQFLQLIDLLEKHAVNYIAYTHPIPDLMLESKREEYERFHNFFREVIHQENKLIDLNGDNFRHFTSDYTNYADHGHLSTKGQAILLELLLKKLEQVARSEHSPEPLPTHREEPVL